MSSGWDIIYSQDAFHDLAELSGGVRVVYKLKRDEKDMKIVVIGMRANNEVYKEAAEREGRS